MSKRKRFEVWAVFYGVALNSVWDSKKKAQRHITHYFTEQTAKQSSVVRLVEYSPSAEGVVRAAKRLARLVSESDSPDLFDPLGGVVRAVASHEKALKRGGR